MRSETRDLPSETDGQHLDLTIVLNVHHEGRLLHPTLRALRDAVDAALDGGLTCELVVVLDKANQATRDYLDTHLDKVLGDLPIRKIEVQNGDLGLSRNDGVDAAAGEWVALCDADNLVCRSWLVEAVAAARQDEGEVVVHPKFVVSFDARDTIWRIRSSRDPLFDALALAQFNFWDATCVAAKSTFQKVRYASTKAGSGFGPEDWHWNLETLSIGIDHVVAERTALFYRVKRTGSLLAQHEASAALLPPTDFLASPESALRINAHNNSDEVLSGRYSKQGLKAKSRRAAFAGARAVAARGYRGLVRVVGRGRRGRVLLRGIRQTLVDVYYEPTAAPSSWGGLPDWLVAEWRAMQKYEPGLFPESSLLGRIGFADPIATRFVQSYWSLIGQVRGPIDYMFIVPFLKTGGADKVILHYIRALAELEPEAKVVVVATEPGESEWAGLLTPNAQFVPVPAEFHALNSFEQEQLLGTAIVQLGPRVIHLVNSHTGYRTVARYTASISATSSIYLSIFCLDRSDEGKVVHYILDDFRKYNEALAGVTTDNQGIADWFVDTYDADSSLFHVHYQPVSGFPAERATSTASLLDEDGVVNIAWAGRFDRQKRLDILVKIAEAAEQRGLPVKFHVYGRTVLGGAKVEEMPSNTVMHGAFDGGLGTLPSDRHGVFLLTSEWEGLPNTLLEAGQLGYVLIAPGVGGVDELVNETTGFLVPDYDDIDGYVRAIEAIIDDPSQASARASALQDLIAERHTWDGFVSSVAATPGYVKSGRQ